MLEDIKETIADQMQLQKGLSLNDAQKLWLIEQAEMLRKIADTWVAIETNGSTEDADNFFTIVQDILTPEQD